MALLSHLDLLRLFDRAIRRAAIPIAYTGGFHPGPRIIPANALSLGITSSGEIVDFELTEPLNLNEFQERLSAQLPADMPIYQVESVDLGAPAATQLLEKAEYLIGIGQAEETGDLPTWQDWQDWIEAVLSKQELLIEHTTKSGKSQMVNLRDRLFTLQLETSAADQTQPLASVSLRYIGSCRNDGTLLRPDQVIYMLEQVANRDLQLLKTHRDRLILATP
jgi:radical SAM-linked protein